MAGKTSAAKTAAAKTEETTAPVAETVLTIEEATARIETLETELEAANAIIAEQAEKLEAPCACGNTEVEALKARLAEFEANAQKASVITKEVPGTYKSKEHKKEIRFLPGFLKTRIGQELIPSEDLIKNKGGKYTEELDRLIEIGYGGIEEVK